MFETKICKHVLDHATLEFLKKDFQTNCVDVPPGRKFNTNISNAVETLMPELKKHLLGDWIVDGGNYFETTIPYRMHCDSGKGNTNIWYNIVIPLQLWTASEYNKELNKLIVTNQVWNNDAAFFVKGDASKDEYNTCVTDYSNVSNLATGTSAELVERCSHLNPANLEGLTIKAAIDWEPGDIIIFKRNLIHGTSNWKQAGVFKKLGLSLFTSRRDQ